LEFNEYLAGECIALMMVFSAYLCLGLALVLCMRYYCDIYYTVNKVGSDLSAGLAVPVEDIHMCQDCFANTSRIHLRLTTISLDLLLTIASTMKTVVRSPTQYFQNFADETRATHRRDWLETEVVDVGPDRQRIRQPR